MCSTRLTLAFHSFLEPGKFACQWRQCKSPMIPVTPGRHHISVVTVALPSSVVDGRPLRYSVSTLPNALGGRPMSVFINFAFIQCFHSSRMADLRIWVKDRLERPDRESTASA